MGRPKYLRRQARKTIRSPTGKPGRGGTAPAFDSGSPLRPERSLRSPVRLRMASSTGRSSQTPLPTPTRVFDRGCAKPCLLLFSDWHDQSRLEPTNRGRLLGKDQETDGESKARRTSQTAIPGTIPCTPVETILYDLPSTTEPKQCCRR